MLPVCHLFAAQCVVRLDNGTAAEPREGLCLRHAQVGTAAPQGKTGFLVLKHCLSGVLSTGGTAATVKMSSAGFEEQEVAAEVAAGGGWKACLAPQKAGGSFTITATCTGW